MPLKRVVKWSFNGYRSVLYTSYSEFIWCSKTVKAVSHILQTGVDGEGSAVFQYDDMDAIIQYSKIADSYIPSEIQGEDGSIIIEKLNLFEKLLLNTEMEEKKIYLFQKKSRGKA